MTLTLTLFPMTLTLSYQLVVIQSAGDSVRSPPELTYKELKSLQKPSNRIACSIMRLYNADGVIVGRQ